MAWPKWVAGRDAEIRGRLAQGEEDSLVNLLLFGTSFTKLPRATPQDVARRAQEEGGPAGGSSPETASLLSNLVQARADDLVRALAAPANNERFLFVRGFVEERGHRVSTPAGRARLKEYLLALLARGLKEQASYARTLEEARQLGDPMEEFAQRSTLFQERGLSLDTSLLPNFALEESLKAMQARGLVAAGGVQRVAIVGPGLDFTDKQAGYDFYPQQTLQPFAVMDTLLRLGLARSDSLEVLTFDISPRVNSHLQQARARARRGQGYVIQLPRDPDAQWNAEAVAYWQRFGDQIGRPVAPAPLPPNAGRLEMRAVRIRPELVSRLTPVDLNVVLQRLELPAAEEGFDLVIATNVFVYYDLFEQSLAVASVERMLRPGGFLLSNNALLELPHSELRSVDYLTVVYSARPDDGDHIVWYQRRRE